MSSPYGRGLWAPVWQGLVDDPGGKHAKRMRLAVWLYLYLIVHANWETGRLMRNFQTISNDMGIPIRTLKGWMSILKKFKYVEIVRNPYSISVQITKWNSIKSKMRSAESHTSEMEFEDERSAEIGIEKCNNLYREVQNPASRAKPCMSVNGSNIKGGCERSAKPHTSNEILNESIYQINQKKKGPKNEIEKFFSFAKQSQKKILNLTLSETRVDEEKISLMLNKFSLPVICIAWVSFLRSKDPYLIKTNSPRNIPVFSGQFPNLSEHAENLFNSSQKKILKNKNPRARTSIGEDESEKWEQCLDSIESEILPANFESFIKPLKLMKIENLKAKIVCANKDSKKYALTECGEEFFHFHLSKAFRKPLQPEFIYDSKA